MVVYTVYEQPHPDSDPAERALKLVFIKDGFLWLAALFPPVWLLFKWLWLEFLGFLLLAAALTWGANAIGAPASSETLPLLILQIAFGFEAGWVQSMALERRGWRMLGAVTGRNEEDCERRFFQTWEPSPPGSKPTPGPSVDEAASSAWTGTMLANARDALARGRRMIGAKA